MSEKLYILFIKVFNVLQFAATNIFTGIIRLGKHTINPKTMLVIRLDRIGDYVLVRNFFRCLKQSQKYAGYRITLAGNVTWKDLAEHFDADLINEFIWIDRDAFYWNWFYRFAMLKKVYKSGFEVVIDPTYSREILYADALVYASGAVERIGSRGAPDPNVKWRRNLLTNKYFTKFITPSEDTLFEFLRNKEFFSQLLGKELDQVKPEFTTTGLPLPAGVPSPFVVVVPGASRAGKRWSTANLARVIEVILAETNLHVVLCGSKGEIPLANDILMRNHNARVTSLAGALTLVELVKLIESATFMVSNDTGTIHVAAAVNTPFICIANGNHLGRFSPYPHEVYDKGYYIFPESIAEENISQMIGDKKYLYEKEPDINSVPVDAVIAACRKLF